MYTYVPPFFGMGETFRNSNTKQSKIGYIDCFEYTMIPIIQKNMLSKLKPNLKNGKTIATCAREYIIVEVKINFL